MPGPVLQSPIHDAGLRRHVCGDALAVLAMGSNALRGNVVEETATMLLRFQNGLLGQMVRVA